MKPIEVLVKDKDFGSSDSCGVTSIPIDDLKLKPLTWAINNIFTLKDGDIMKGSIYILAKFIPDGQTDNGNQPQLLIHK